MRVYEKLEKYARSLGFAGCYVRINPGPRYHNRPRYTMFLASGFAYCSLDTLERGKSELRRLAGLYVELINSGHFQRIKEEADLDREIMELSISAKHREDRVDE